MRQSNMHGNKNLIIGDPRLNNYNLTWIGVLILSICSFNGTIGVYVTNFYHILMHDSAPNRQWFRIYW